TTRGDFQRKLGRKFPRSPDASRGDGSDVLPGLLSAFVMAALRCSAAIFAACFRVAAKMAALQTIALVFAAALAHTEEPAAMPAASRGGQRRNAFRFRAGRAHVRLRKSPFRGGVGPQAAGRRRARLVRGF